jgi:hypothetical protein
MRTSGMKANVHRWLSGTAWGNRPPFLASPRGMIAMSAVAAALVGAMANPNQLCAAGTSPGKRLAIESTDFGGGDIPVAFVPLLAASIVKGKRKHVLVIQATLSSGSSPVAGWLGIRARVNGFDAVPPGQFSGDIQHQSCGGNYCTVTGTWWLDLDAAEVAHPGAFVSQPLTIVLDGGEFPMSPQSTGSATMSVRMERK